MDKVAVVILNWNGKDFLNRFLPSVIQHSPEAVIYLADNCSTDGSVEFVKQSFKEVRIIQNCFNAGFTEGYNLALSQIQSEYYLLLNSDVEVTPGWLPPLIKIMDSDQKIAACQPKILSWEEKNKFEYAGAAGGFIDSLGYPFCRGRIFQTTEEDQGQYNDEKEIFWATGACMMVRAAIFHKLGGFDKEFFAHMEEIDLCWRMKNRGYKIMYTGFSSVYHVGGGTLSKINPHKTYLNFRNSLSLLVKNMPVTHLWKTFLIRLILDGIAGTKFFFSDSPMHTWAVIKSHFYIYFKFGRLLNKRKQNIKESIEFSHPEIYPKSIVQTYYLEKKQVFKDLEWNR